MKRDQSAVQVASIGFTGKTARKFFDLLKGAHVRTVLDVRLNNTSQLAGFAKRQDLPYFLENLCNTAYVEVPELAPELSRTLKTGLVVPRTLSPRKPRTFQLVWA